LALASAHVYARQHVHHARLRLRESVLSSPGNFQPASVSRISPDPDTGGVLKTKLHPIDKVSDCLKDGDSVEVTLIDKIRIGRNGIPEPPEFFVNAFSTNMHIKERLKTRLEKQRIKDEKQRKADKKRKEDARKRIFGSIDSADALAFEKEFDMIKRKKFINIDDVDDLQETLARYFEELDQLFKHFNGYAAGENHLISYAEFTHCMHKTRMLDIIKDASIIKQIFLEADIPLEDDVYADGAFQRSEFVEALVRVGKHRWRDIAVADSMDNLMQDYILPFLDKCKVTEIQQTLESPEIRSVAADNFKKLFRAFRRYCKFDYIHSKSKVTEAGTMNLVEFRGLLRESRLIPIPGAAAKETKGDRKKTKNAAPKAPKVVPSADKNQNARKAFARAQQTAEGSDIADLAEMTYPEFILGLLWFAMLQKSSESDYMDYKHMSLVKRVESFSDVVNHIVAHQTGYEKRLAGKGGNDTKGPST